MSPEPTDADRKEADAIAWTMALEAQNLTEDGHARLLADITADRIEFEHTGRRKLSPEEQEQALHAIEKGQQMAGHFPTADDMDRAALVLAGEASAEEAKAELETKFRPPAHQINNRLLFYRLRLLLY